MASGSLENPRQTVSSIANRDAIDGKFDLAVAELLFADSSVQLLVSRMDNRMNFNFQSKLMLINGGHSV